MNHAHGPHHGRDTQGDELCQVIMLMTRREIEHSGGHGFRHGGDSSRDDGVTFHNIFQHTNELLFPIFFIGKVVLCFYYNFYVLTLFQNHPF